MVSARPYMTVQGFRREIDFVRRNRTLWVLGVVTVALTMTSIIALWLWPIMVSLVPLGLFLAVFYDMDQPWVPSKVPEDWNDVLVTHGIERVMLETYSLSRSGKTLSVPVGAATLLSAQDLRVLLAFWEKDRVRTSRQLALFLILLSVLPLSQAFDVPGRDWVFGLVLITAVGFRVYGATDRMRQPTPVRRVYERFGR